MELTRFTNRTGRALVGLASSHSARYSTLYLLAIVLANLSVAAFGPSVAVLNAFLFIGLDLTARDRLHDAWQGDGLMWKMGALIATGSVLSWALNRNAGPIALASFVAFAAASVTDALVYQRLMAHPRLLRINGSNVPSAAVDSVIFPALAFGLPLLWPVMVGQFIAKVAGGAVWSVVLTLSPWDWRRARARAHHLDV